MGYPCSPARGGLLARHRPQASNVPRSGPPIGPTKMNPSHPPQQPAASDLPETWRSRVFAQLHAGEQILAVLLTDLDEHLRFTAGIVLATDRRLLACTQPEGLWLDWPHVDGLVLRKRDHAGVGSLELLDGQRRHAVWRYTLEADGSAQRLIDAFEHARLTPREAAEPLSHIHI